MNGSANLLHQRCQKHGPNVVNHHLTPARTESKSVRLTELLEGGLGPDDEPADMSAGGELQQVQVVHLRAASTLLYSVSVAGHCRRASGCVARRKYMPA